ncbi:MAG: type II secretion system protein GspC [Thermodesulfobacteriota bacterium]
MNHVFTIINLVLIAFLSFFGVKGCYRLATLSPVLVEPADSSTVPPTMTADKAVQPLSAYNEIIRRNLFQTRKTAAGAIPDDKILEGMKQTELSLKLWGTVTRDKDQGAYAVIEDTKERRQDLYREGDTIQNAVLKLILREQVVLTVNGRDEKLSMEEKPGVTMGGPQPLAGPASVVGAGAQRITLMRSQIDTAMQNVSELMGQVKVRPYFENGQPEGLMLSSVNPQSIFRRMGLRNGDVITGVDGQRIESVDDALKFYESIRSSSGLTLEIKRQGRPRTIEYMIK